MTTTVALPYYGITGMKQLRPLVKMIRSTNSKAKVVVHRDRDFLTDAEVEEWKKEVRSHSIEPFVTAGRDIEAQFINAKYLAERNPEHSEKEFSTLISDVLQEQREQLVTDYVNGRVDITRKLGHAGKLNHGQLAVEAQKAISVSPA
jgi:hypothetical protein